jgi:hypothetical protein
VKISQILDRPIAFHRVFVTLTGSVKAAILLSQAMYWQSRATQKDGWWYKTAEDWQEETGLTRREQERARQDCSKYLKTDLRGVPATLFWQVDEEALTTDLIQQISETSFDKKGKLDLPKSENINRTETTTETTRENSADEPRISEFTGLPVVEKKPLSRKSQEELRALVDEGFFGGGKLPVDYPEDIRETLQIFCECWNIVPPGKNNKSQYSYWIKCTRELMDAMGEFGVEIIGQYYEEFTKNPYFVTTPASIAGMVRAFAGTKRSTNASMPGQFVY